MPKPKRPADLNKRAKSIVDIATGELENDSRNPAAVALGSMGGKARAKALTKKKRTEIAKKGAAKRWASKKPEK